MEHMLAAFVKKGGGVELRILPRPELEDGAILVSMKASGICGTDLEKLIGGGITSPIIGHEVSGTVAESSCGNFVKGDRVIPHHHVSCNECDLCLAGAQTMCERFKNSHFKPGGFADEFLVPAYNVSRGGVYKISNELGFEEASFAEPLGCCIRGLVHAGVMNAELMKGSLKPRNVLVVGAGPIGLLHMEVLRSEYPDIVITAVDMVPGRLNYAEKNENANVVDATKFEGGAFSEASKKIVGPTGYDLVIIATGSEKAFGESVRCVRKSGRLLQFGVPHKGATYSLDLANLMMDELTITSSYATSESELKTAIALLESKKINVKKFITSRYPLGRIEEAMLAARSSSQVKGT